MGKAYEIRKAIWRVTLGAICLTVAMTIKAQAIASDLPSQSLASSLRDVASQTHTNILFDGKLVRSLIAPQLQVQANMSVEGALGQLLAGTALGYRWTDRHTILIVPASSAAPQGSSKNFPGPLVAQANPPPAPQEADTTIVPSGQLQEVVVTAERRRQDLQRTPVAVTALRGSDLREQGRFNAKQILEDVPSVSFQTPASGTNSYDSPANSISIRGITSNSTVNGALGVSEVPAVAYYVDGVLNGIGGNYDIAQVQVLRGPQGTLYGRSATAGAFVVQTTDPEIGRWGGNATVEVGDYSLRHYSAAVNLPAGDTVALRVSGNDYVREGYYAPIGGRVDTLDGRAKLLFKPTSDFSALIGFAAQDNAEYYGQVSGFITGLGTNNVAYNLPVPIGTGYDQTRQYWAQITWNLGAATLTYVPALRDFQQHLQFSQAPSKGVLINATADVLHDPFHTEELRLASNPGTPLQWQTGLFYYDNDLRVQDNGNLVIFGNPAGVLFNLAPLTRSTQNVGLFAESTYSFTSSTRVTAGVRGDYTKIRTTATSCSGRILACLTVSPEEGTRIWHNFTYKARVEHDLTASNMVYASLASAFLPGDVSVTTGPGGNPVAAPYEPETLNALELGSKNRFVENRLQINGDLFYYRYGGYQAPVEIGQSPIPGGPIYYATLGSPARMAGAELEATYLPTPDDRFGLSVSYNDGYYIDKPAAFAAGITNSHFANVIPWNIDPSYSHTLHLPGGQVLTFLGEALYHSSYLVANLSNVCANSICHDYIGVEPYLTNGDTLVGNFTLTWNFVRQASLSAYVRNVSDVRYKIRAGLTSATPVANSAELSDPRTLGVVLSARF